MGIGLAIVSWCFKGTAIATVLAILAGTLAALYIPRGHPRRTRSILWACSFPFACFCWILAVILFQAYVNETHFYRDPGIGHIWQTPRSNWQPTSAGFCGVQLSTWALLNFKALFIMWI